MAASRLPCKCAIPKGMAAIGRVFPREKPKVESVPCSKLTSDTGSDAGAAAPLCWALWPVAEDAALAGSETASAASPEAFRNLRRSGEERLSGLRTRGPFDRNSYRCIDFIGCSGNGKTSLFPALLPLREEAPVCQRVLSGSSLEAEPSGANASIKKSTDALFFRSLNDVGLFTGNQIDDVIRYSCQTLSIVQQAVGSASQAAITASR